MDLKSYLLGTFIGSSTNSCQKAEPIKTEQKLVNSLNKALNYHLKRELTYDYISHHSIQELDKLNLRIFHFQVNRNVTSFDQGYNENGLIIKEQEDSIYYKTYEKYISDRKIIREGFYNLIRAEVSSDKIYAFISTEIENLNSNRYSQQAFNCIDPTINKELFSNDFPIYSTALIGMAMIFMPKKALPFFGLAMFKLAKIENQNYERQFSKNLLQCKEYIEKSFVEDPFELNKDLTCTGTDSCFNSEI